MLNENSVIFKGRKNGVIIALDDKTAFGDIKTVLRKKLLNAHSFFEDTDTSITFKGRELTEEEEDELIDIITTYSGISIKFTRSLGKIVLQKRMDDDILVVPPNIAVSNKEQVNLLSSKLNKILKENESVTMFHSGSLRSGQSIRYVGSLVIIGDINPGAEVIAEGNIVILGALMGLAHAGCGGDSRCFVSSLLMRPTQLRIADVITYLPPELMKRNKRMYNLEPVYAYVQSKIIYIVNLTN